MKPNGDQISIHKHDIYSYVNGTGSTRVKIASGLSQLATRGMVHRTSGRQFWHLFGSPPNTCLFSNRWLNFIYTENQDLLWCQLCHHWWHWRLLWQPPVPPMKAKLASSSWWLVFHCMALVWMFITHTVSNTYIPVIIFYNSCLLQCTKCRIPPIIIMMPHQWNGVSKHLSAWLCLTVLTVCSDWHQRNQQSSTLLYCRWSWRSPSAGRVRGFVAGRRTAF